MKCCGDKWRWITSLACCQLQLGLLSIVTLSCTHARRNSRHRSSSFLFEAAASQLPGYMRPAAHIQRLQPPAGAPRAPERSIGRPGGAAAAARQSCTLAFLNFGFVPPELLAA